MTQAHQLGPGQADDTVVITIRGGDAETHDSATPKVVCQFEFDPGEYVLANATMSLILRAVAGNGAAGLTTHARMYNLTDAEYVGAGLDFTVEAPTKKEESLTVGAGAGEIDDAAKVYEIRIWVDAPTDPSHTINLGSAELRIVNTVD
jgi:hypothetical protein